MTRGRQEAGTAVLVNGETAAAEEFSTRCSCILSGGAPQFDQRWPGRHSLSLADRSIHLPSGFLLDRDQLEKSNRAIGQRDDLKNVSV